MMNRETLFVQFEGTKPFIQCTVTDESGRVLLKAVDSSVGNLIKECRMRFRGYNLQSLLPQVKST